MRKPLAGSALLIALGVAFGTVCCAAAAHAGTVTLPSADMRSVELAKDVDANDWADRNGIEPLERVPLAGGGAIVRFAMDEGVWRARNGALCTDTGVVSCGTDFCQTYFVPQQDEAPAALMEAPAAQVETPAAQVETPAAQMQDEQPTEDARLELRLIETQDDEERTAVEASVVGEDGVPLPGARVLLVPRAPDVESLFAPADGASFDPAQVPGERSCRRDPQAGSRLLSALTSDKGTFIFPAAGDPSVDRGCWEIVTAAACQTRVQPLSDLLPEREPQRVLVLAALNGKNGALDPGVAQRLSQMPGLRALETTVLAAIGKALVRFEISDATLDARSVLVSLREQPGVAAAQSEYRYRTAAQFNDPYAWMNYGARLTGAESLLAATSGAGVRIAVIDSGVDGAHPELSARVAERIDVTGFGATADRHGTAVAGLIAAEANNQLGAFGMAPGASVIAIKACEPESRNAVGARCWSSTIAKALDVALARDARIINLSLTGPRDPLVSELIDAAIAKSRLVIAAAGNGGPDAAPSFPASHAGVIAVTAIDTRARLYPQATRGTFVDLAAPGVEVPVPVPGSTYPGQLSGTSMAAAYVSGIAALLLGGTPNADANALRRALESTAVSLGDARGATQFGRGRIDACAAAVALGQQHESCAAPTPATGAQP